MQVIGPALSRGEVILCDRFTDSTFAYQGGGRGFDLEVLSVLEQWVQGTALPGYGADGDALLQPHLTLWFDLPAAVAAQRLVGARAPDKFESQSVEFFDKVVAAYSQRCQANPARFARINANQSAADVWRDVLSLVRARGVLV
jgi:dTMP kinase